MDEYIISVIADISRQKSEANVVPTAVLMSEIKNRIVGDAKNALNRLCQKQKIVFHRTLNDVSFEISDNNIQKI